MTQQEQALSQEDISVKVRSDIVIIAAEDEQGHYLLIEHCLRNAGISNEILWFEDGKSTLDFFTGEAFGRDGKKYLLLLDIRMPGIDGIEVLEKIKKDEPLSRVPVIMLTTSEDHELAARCYSLGCEAHVVKPPGATLLKAIKRVCQRL